MIRVYRKAESNDFDQKVRQPGLAYLQQNPNPTSQQFKRKNFWKRALGDLNAAYGGICSYSAMYLPDGGSVDHFLPKSDYPRLAYEWSNYRLSNPKINSSKGNATNIADPFEIQNEWFRLDLPSCLIKSNPDLDRPTKRLVNDTVNTLRLNSDDSFVSERCDILIAFARGELSATFLARRYPFLYQEVERQGVEGQLATIFSLL